MEDKKSAAIHKYKVQSRLIFCISVRQMHGFARCLCLGFVGLIGVQLMFASDLEYFLTCWIACSKSTENFRLRW